LVHATDLSGYFKKHPNAVSNVCEIVVVFASPAGWRCQRISPQGNKNEALPVLAAT
jgi:hypothetical protein